MTDNLTDKFIDSIYSLSRSKIPDSIMHQAKRCLLDYLGVTFAGARLIQVKGEKLLEIMKCSAGESSVIGFNKKTSAENAAFINGLSSHIAELDDGVISGIVHPGSPVISALLPVAEKEKVRGEDLIKGVIVGYEAVTRIADAIQPSHKKRGYHATGTCGTIGASIGIAAMLGLSKTKFKSIFSTAAISAHGTLKVLEDDSELKPYNVAQAAINAVLAVSVGRVGFSGPNDVLSGSNGFISMVSDDFDADQLMLKNCGPFAVERVYVKPYAACRYCHSAIDAVLKMRAEHSLRAEMIKSVKVVTYALAVAKHDHILINGISSAKMSIPYSVAVAIVTGKAGIEEYNDACIANSEVMSLAKKVSVRSDDELTALFPKYSAAVIEVETLGGNKFVERIDSPKGEATFPLSDYDIEAKFIELAVYGHKSKDEIQQIVEKVWNLENELHTLFQLL